jgi:hypothetical protein
MKVISVTMGLPRTARWTGKAVSTGIFRTPVSGRTRLRTLDFDGDPQADLSAHGGPDRPARRAVGNPGNHPSRREYQAISLRDCLRMRCGLSEAPQAPSGAAFENRSGAAYMRSIWLLADRGAPRTRSRGPRREAVRQSPRAGDEIDRQTGFGREHRKPGLARRTTAAGALSNNL